MHKYATTGLALAVTVIAAGCFLVGAFLGFNFFCRGYLFVSAPVALAAFGAFVYGLVMMIRGKASHNYRIGQRRERLAILGVVAILAVGSVFFTKALQIYDRQQELTDIVRQTVVAVEGIDSCYYDYVDQRVAAVKRKAGKADANLLERRLLPDSCETIVEDRHEWLQSLNEAKVSNLWTATNVRHLQEAAEQWTEEYTILSSVILACEPDSVTPFAHDESARLLSQFSKEFSELHSPDARSLAGMALCIACILLCYFSTRRPTSQNEGTTTN